jgi:hypothetical protein
LLAIADAAREDLVYTPRPGSIRSHETGLPARLRHLRNSVTILEMCGGGIELRESRALASKSYPSGSDAKTLLQDALDALDEVQVVLGSEESVAGATVATSPGGLRGWAIKLLGGAIKRLGG